MNQVTIIFFGDFDIKSRFGLGEKLEAMGYGVVYVGANLSDTGVYGSKKVYSYSLPRKFSIVQSFKFVIEVYRLLKEIERPAVLHSFDTLPGFLIPIYSSIFGYRNVKTVTGMGKAYVAQEEKIDWSKKIYLLFYTHAQRLSCFFCHSVIFQNKHDLDYFVSNEIVPYRKCFLVKGSGVEPPFFSRSKNVGDVIRFIMISRITREKGVFRYLDAVNSLDTKYSHEHRFSIAGNLIDDSSKSQRYFESSLGAVQYLGYSDDVSTLYKDNDVLVLPTSYGEGVPRVLLEASAYGLFLIVTKAPGCTELVETLENGIVLDDYNVSSLQETLQYLMDHGVDYVRSTGANGTHSVFKHYSLDNVASSYSLIYSRFE